ncbi:hypothetical protein Q5O14_16665 [Eubacteriaceae bacterium ES2]|nr:hypothetical protein Q5O14_16665 [Eubacteriaceae bacterium ES2]
MRELGELFGWLLIGAYAGTLLNFILKVINKRYGKVIKKNHSADKVMKLLMMLFVKNHKYFGIATLILLLSHFAIQYSRFGFNITGLIAATLMATQVGLGIYATVTKRKRKGTWFVIHRGIALLIFVGIAIHLLVPHLFG